MAKAVYRISSIGFPEHKMPRVTGAVDAEDVERQVAEIARKFVIEQHGRSPMRPHGCIAEWFMVDSVPESPDRYLESLGNAEPAGRLAYYMRETQEDSAHDHEDNLSGAE